MVKFKEGKFKTHYQITVNASRSFSRVQVIELMYKWVRGVNIPILPPISSEVLIVQTSEGYSVSIRGVSRLNPNAVSFAEKSLKDFLAFTL